MLRFYWTPVVASRVHVFDFYPPTTQEAPWSRIVLAFVWTTAYLYIPGQLSIVDSMDTVKISKRFACANELSKWQFGKLEYGYRQWPTLFITVADLGKELGRPRPPLIFRLNWGRARRAEKKFLETGPPRLISGSGWQGAPPYLKVWIHHCIII